MIAPLLGLLGTLGKLEQGLSVRVGVVEWASLISDSLGTLTAGVGLAILAFVAFDGLTERAEGLVERLERVGSETVDSITCHGGEAGIGTSRVPRPHHRELMGGGRVAGARGVSQVTGADRGGADEYSDQGGQPGVAMTGLNLETFLRLLKTDPLVWTSLGVVGSLLGLMLWTSLRARKLLRRCLAISVLLHVGLIATGGQTEWGQRIHAAVGRVAARGSGRVAVAD